MDCTPEQIRRSAEDCQAKQDFDANFSLIYECLLPKIRRFLESKNIPRDIAEELSQDVFIRVFKSMAGFRDEAPFEAWVYVIAQRVLADHWRGQNTKKRAGDKDALPLHGGGDGDRTESRIDVAERAASPRRAGRLGSPEGDNRGGGETSGGEAATARRSARPRRPT